MKLSLHQNGADISKSKSKRNLVIGSQLTTKLVIKDTLQLNTS